MATIALSCKATHFLSEKAPTWWADRQQRQQSYCPTPLGLPCCNPPSRITRVSYVLLSVCVCVCVCVCMCVCVCVCVFVCLCLSTPNRKQMNCTYWRFILDLVQAVFTLNTEYRISWCSHWTTHMSYNTNNETYILISKQCLIILFKKVCSTRLKPKAVSKGTFILSIQYLYL